MRLSLKSSFHRPFNVELLVFDFHYVSTSRSGQLTKPLALFRSGDGRLISFTGSS